VCTTTPGSGRSASTRIVPASTVSHRSARAGSEGDRGRSAAATRASVGRSEAPPTRSSAARSPEAFVATINTSIGSSAARAPVGERRNSPKLTLFTCSPRAEIASASPPWPRRRRACRLARAVPRSVRPRPGASTAIFTARSLCASWSIPRRHAARDQPFSLSFEMSSQSPLRAPIYRGPRPRAVAAGAGESHWREEFFEPSDEHARAADAAIAELQQRGSPSHDGSRRACRVQRGR